MELARAVYDYYYTHRAELSEDKQFHFATRTAAWFGYEESFGLLHELRDFIVQPNRPLKEVVAEVYHTPQTGRRNAHELRQPFFEKYPKLYGAHLALFRVRHLEEVYGIDARDALFASVSKDELIELEHQLLADEEAMRVLSTFAINYCYLLERVVLKDETSLPLDYFLKLGASYDLSQKEHVQLLIYLYTHCIIGESNFYTRRIPEESLATYRSMLAILEPAIERSFEDINLDNKLEFLVCAQICDFQTGLADRIYKECEQSVSEEGTFVIDRFNSNGQDDRNDFVKSEHRNVLYVMSTQKYDPKSTRIS